MNPFCAKFGSSAMSSRPRSPTLFTWPLRSMTVRVIPVVRSDNAMTPDLPAT